MKHNNYTHHNYTNHYHNLKRDCTKSVISVINRAYRETSILTSYDAQKMINYVTLHQFRQSPAQAMHSIINTYENTSILSSYDARNQLWNILHPYSR